MIRETLRAMLPLRALENSRYLTPEEDELAQKLRKRRKHREAERDIRN